MIGQNTACATCGKSGAGQLCGACKTVRYCNKDCQLKHWPTHYLGCGKAAAPKKPAKQAPKPAISNAKRSLPIAAPVARVPVAPPTPAMSDDLKKYIEPITGSKPTSAASIALLKKLQAAGFQPMREAGRCAMAAILAGHLVFNGTKAELDQPARMRGGKQVIVSDQRERDEADCRCDDVRPTLRQLLEQPDYGGNDYECGLEEATACCKHDNLAAYVTGMCTGRFSSDSGKYHNHCPLCPFPGRCLGDYRERHCEKCGDHFMASAYSESDDCPSCSRPTQRRRGSGSSAGMGLGLGLGMGYGLGGGGDSDSEDEYSQFMQALLMRSLFMSVMGGRL